MRGVSKRGQPLGLRIKTGTNTPNLHRTSPEPWNGTRTTGMSPTVRKCDLGT